MPVVVHCIGFKLTQLPTKCMHFFRMQYFVVVAVATVDVALSLLPAFVWLWRCEIFPPYSTVRAGTTHQENLALCVCFSRISHSYGSVALWDSKIAGMLLLSCMFRCPRLTLSFDLHPGLYVGFCFHSSSFLCVLYTLEAELQLTLLFNIYFVMYGLHTVQNQRGRIVSDWVRQKLQTH